MQYLSVHRKTEAILRTRDRKAMQFCAEKSRGIKMRIKTREGGRTKRVLQFRKVLGLYKK